MIVRLSNLARSGVLCGMLACLTLAGCSTVQRSHEAQRIPQFGEVDAGQPAEMRKVNLPPYVIEAPDELEIQARPAVSDLALNTYTVQPDGTVDLGFAGQVTVSGSTLADAEARIAAQLDAATATPGHKVSVRLSSGQSKYYYVLGTVNQPGRFKITGNETVLDAITQAGLKSNSLPEKAYLVRPHLLGAADQVYAVDWHGIKDRGDTLTNYQIMPGDRLVVPGTRAPSLIRSLIGG